jgi:transposase
LPLSVRPDQQDSAACAAHARLGPASLVLYDVPALYFETDRGDGFRESGFSKERRLEPQITIGLLADQAGFPLMVSAFEGNKAETKTMLRVIEAFMAAHELPDVTVVADSTSSPPLTRSPTTSAKPSTPSTTSADLRTKLSQLRT